jgi:hypothetical protein
MADEIWKFKMARPQGRHCAVCGKLAHVGERFYKLNRGTDKSIPIWHEEHGRDAYEKLGKKEEPVELPRLPGDFKRDQLRKIIPEKKAEEGTGAKTTRAFKVGNKVRVKATGEETTITKVNDDGTYETGEATA